MDVSTCHPGYAALERLQRHRRLFHRSSKCEVALSRSRRTLGSSLKPSVNIYGPQLFRAQSRLPQVIGQMIGATQQDGETVTQRFLHKVFLRHGAVLLQPVRRRETCKPLEQSAVNFSPGLPNQLDRRNSGLRLIGIGNERDIKLGMKPLPKTQQREHRVMSGREMSPEIDQAVFSGCDFFQGFFFAETRKYFIGSLDIS